MKKKSIIYDLRDQEFFDFLTTMLNEEIDFEKDDVIQSLLVMSLNEIDFELADKLCTKFIHDKDKDIKVASLQAIGHIARVYKKLVNKDLYNYICKIYKDKKHPQCGYAEDALSDIQIFLNIPKPDDIVDIKMKKENADAKGFVFFKDTALRLNNSIDALFDEKDTPIVLPEGELSFESDTLHITIRFEEIKE